jgi:putative oxidoreductase
MVQYNKWMTTEKREQLFSIGLLILRVSIGSMMLLSHGWGKLLNFSERSATFADPIGLGSVMSMALTVFAEFFCSLAIILGLFSRMAAIPIIITMLVSAFIIHIDDPWNKKEFALLYLIPFLLLVFSGAGRYSLDALFFKKGE